MKTTLKYIFIILLFTACVQKNHKHTSEELYNCGPDDFPSLLIKSVFCEDTLNYKDLYYRFNDSLKTRNLPVALLQFSCENESQQKFGITFIETDLEFGEINLIEFWVLVNYDDDIGIHIETENLRDSLIKELDIIDKNLTGLYDKIRQNPDADSLIRPQIFISLNVKTNADKQISMDDYRRLTDYLSVLARIVISRVDDLSVMLWGKSYGSLQMRQKEAVCKSLGYLLQVNIL